MNEIIIYGCKIVAASGILFLYYIGFLKNKKFHYYNRFFLLAAVVFSLLAPLLQMKLLTITSSNHQALQLMNIMQTNEGEAFVAVDDQPAISWPGIIAFAFALLSVFFSIRLISRMVYIKRLMKQYPVSKMDGFALFNTDLKQAPFSFLNNIFWRNNIEISDATGRQILQHEITHVKEKHTWDKIGMQVLLCFCWINPFYWLIQKELCLIHEFIADEKSVEEGDTETFAHMLLTTHYGKNIFLPAQSFFYSPIKRRLLMLSKSQKTNYSYARKIMALPLLIAVIALFAFRIQDAASNKIKKANTPFKLVVDAGHGGTDFGAAGIGGLLEKELTLSIAKKIKDLSSEYGINVILTRDADIFMNPEEKATFSNKQKADAFISIHTNAATEKDQDDAGGFEIFIANNNDNGLLPKSKMLASGISQTLSTSFKLTPFILQRSAGIWVLQANTAPSVLIECGFITNAADVKMLKEESGMEMIARKILEGAVLYANNKASAPENLNWQKDTSGYDINMFEGKPIIKTNIDLAKEAVTISFKDGTVKTITLDEAVKAHIVQRIYNPQSTSDTTDHLVPPPPPPAKKMPVKSIFLGRYDNKEISGISVQEKTNLVVITFLDGNKKQITREEALKNNLPIPPPPPPTLKPEAGIL